MAETRQETISIKSDSAGSNSGVLTTQVLTSGERVGNALKILAICWVLAVITAFIPIAHFVLVPLFAIAGPVMAFMKYGVENVTDNTKGICPECQQEITIDLDPSDKLPKWTYCPKCNKPLQLLYQGGGSES